MSADNVIYIQKRGDKWWAWHQSASSSFIMPAPNDAHFDNRAEATEWAFGLQEDIGYVEYGVNRLSDTPETTVIWFDEEMEEHVEEFVDDAIRQQKESRE